MEGLYNYHKGVKMKKINILQIKDYIAQVLRNEIFLGSIQDGDELTQECVAEKLGVSRMPVREAFQLLEQEGFLERLPNGRTKVNGVSEQSILNIFQILSSIESEISLLIIKYNKDIEPIRISLNNCKMALLERNKESCIENELNFHMQLSTVLDDKYIKKLHTNILEGYLLYALKNINYDIKISIKNLENILISIQNEENEKIYKKFNIYYKDITKTIVEGLDHE